MSNTSGSLRVSIILILQLLCVRAAYGEVPEKRRELEFITQFPPSIRTQMKGVFAQLQEQNYEEAVKLYSKAIQREAKCQQLYERRAELLSELKLYHQAIADLSKAIQLDPTYSMNYVHRGREYRRLGLIDKAMSDFSFAISTGNTVACVDRAKLYLLKKEYRKASDDLTIVLHSSKNPGELIWSYNQRAYAYDQLGEHKLAKMDRQKANAAMDLIFGTDLKKVKDYKDLKI